MEKDSRISLYPKTEEERQWIGCSHVMILASQLAKEDRGDKTKGFIMHCKFPEAGENGSELLKRTRRFMFMEQVCTECMLRDVQELFKRVDANLNEERRHPRDS